MEHEQQDNKRRYTDQPAYIRKVGGMSIITVAATIAAVAAVGNMFWQSKDKAQECQQQLEVRITSTEKDMVEIKTDLKYLIRSMDEIKNKVNR
jgi:flagellar basal body-associated protein FliL